MMNLSHRVSVEMVLEIIGENFMTRSITTKGIRNI